MFTRNVSRPLFQLYIMILKTQISLNLYGDRFSPYKFSQLTGVLFDATIEKGVTHLLSGRYKGQLSPYSSATLSAETKTGQDYNQVLYEFLQSFYDQINNHLNSSLVDNMTLWITFSFDKDGQYGFEIRPDILLLLGEMKATLATNINI